MNIIALLDELRTHGGAALTQGLPDDVITRFAQNHPLLTEAVTAANEAFHKLVVEEPDLLAMDERAQIDAIQSGFVNFYSDDTVNPYVSLAARGPWLITLKGAVLHDSGGYGMMAFGHAPESVLDAMNGK